MFLRVCQPVSARRHQPEMPDIVKGHVNSSISVVCRIVAVWIVTSCSLVGTYRHILPSCWGAVASQTERCHVTDPPMLFEMWRRLLHRWCPYDPPVTGCPILTALLRNIGIPTPAEASFPTRCPAQCRSPTKGILQVSISWLIQRQSVDFSLLPGSSLPWDQQVVTKGKAAWAFS